MMREPLPSLGHRIAHTLAIGGGWFIYFWLWWRVIYVYDQGLSSLVVLFLVGVLIILPTMTMIWILHNIRIFKHKGLRRERAMMMENHYVSDWKGRRVIASWLEMQDATSIVISVNGNDKHYQTQSHFPPPITTHIFHQ